MGGLLDTLMRRRAGGLFPIDLDLDVGDLTDLGPGVTVQAEIRSRVCGRLLACTNGVVDLEASRVHFAFSAGEVRLEEHTVVRVVVGLQPTGKVLDEQLCLISGRALAPSPTA